MSFSAVQLPDNKNQLFDLAGIDQAVNNNNLGELRVKGGQQELDNATQLRGLAPQLATGDRDAMATASTLGPNGTGAVNSIVAANEAALKNNQANVSTLGHLGMALTTMDPAHQEAAYGMIAPGLRAQGFKVPEQYPGPDAIRGFASMALDPNKVFESLNSMPSTDPRGPWFGSGGPGASTGGGPNGGGGGTSSGGNASAPSGPLSVPKLAPEAALSTVTDPQARDLVARAAARVGLPPEAIPFWIAGLHNESGGSPNLRVRDGAAGEIGPGQIMPTTGQGMGYTLQQLRDPGTNLEASAKYFNQQWQRSNGDGVGALRGYNGGNPGNQKAQPYAVAAVGRMNSWGGSHAAPAAPAGAAPVAGQPVLPRPVQVASANATAGMPQTMTDAAPVLPASGVQPENRQPAAANQPARPALANADDVVSIDTPEGAQSLPTGARYSVAGGPIQIRAPSSIPNSNTLLPYAGTDGASPPNVLAALGLSPDQAGGQAPASAPATTPNQLLSAAPQAPSAAAAAVVPPSASGPGPGQQPMAPQQQMPPPQQGPAAASSVPSGTKPLYVKGLPEKIEGKPGYMMGIAPDGSRVAMPMPGAPPKIKSTPVGGFMINTDENTGQEVSRFPIPDARKPIHVETSEGTRIFDPSGANQIGFVPKGSRDIDVQAYKEDRDQAQQQVEAGMSAQQGQVRLLEAREVLQGLPTGAGGDARTAWANYADTYMPPGFAAAFKSKLGLPDSVPAQEFTKLMTQNSGQQESGVMGARGGVQALKIFMGANPSMNLQPLTNRQLLNNQLVMSQADQDYAAGHIAFVNQNGDALRRGEAYQPASKFSQQWASQRNPQVYAAAMGAMNGQDFGKWAKNLRPEEIARVGGIIGRIDPSTTVMGPTGKAFRVPAPQQQGAQQ